MRPHDGRAIPNFVRQALANEPLTGTATARRRGASATSTTSSAASSCSPRADEHYPVNIGNPGEFTILELAQAVLKVTGSNSEIVFEALPVDDPQIRQPDITRARQLLGLGAGDPSRGRAPAHAWKGAGRCVSGGGSWRRPWRPPPACACPLPAEAPPRTCRSASTTRARRFFGNLDQVFSQYKALHVGVLRVNLYWGGPLGVAKHRPFVGTDPRDAGYDWTIYDRTAFYAASHGIKLLFSITGTPRWANGEQSSNRPPTNFALRGASPTPPPPATAAPTSATTAGSCRPFACGRPGTSRTTRPSCGRSS